MSGGGGGGGGSGPLDSAASGGEFLLKLLQNPPSSSSAASNRHQHQHHHVPAVAAVVPAIPIPSWQDVRPVLFPQSSPPPNLPRPYSHWPLPDRFDFPGPSPGSPVFYPSGFHESLGPPPQTPQNGVLAEGGLTFGSLKWEGPEVKGFASAKGGVPAARAPDVPPGFGVGGDRCGPDLMQRVERNTPSPHELNRAGRAPGGMRGKQQNRPGRRQFRRDSGSWADDERRLVSGRSVPLSAQLEPGQPSGADLRSAPKDDGAKLEGPSHEDVGSEGEEDKEGGTLSEQLMDSVLLRDESAVKNSGREFNSSRGKDMRSNVSRGLQIPSMRMRSRRRVMDCRRDIERLTPYFLSIYESLIPSEEEKVKQKQLLGSLEKLINKEWPNAQLFLYGSCANSFAFSNSDIDVCLAIDEEDASKADIVLKLADILQSDNLQNVQPLTRARVPIVKLMDPDTGISCDICINNVLAVVNTKLLRDYSQIDARLHQLAFIVKHWAKSRGVNETYRGTLSSYAYVLMCIHFLQLREPAILPCLQEMKATYVVNVDNVECAYFDKVEDLRGFGSLNRESISRLLWEFFDYWAFRHDYANGVISVRTGRTISKREKDWTRRIGNDRHLICIEDPFEVSHDLGRVVDKYSIKILREEFERAAYVLQYNPNPNVTLFEPYVPN